MSGFRKISCGFVNSKSQCTQCPSKWDATLFCGNIALYFIAPVLERDKIKKKMDKNIQYSLTWKFQKHIFQVKTF